MKEYYAMVQIEFIQTLVSRLYKKLWTISIELYESMHFRTRRFLKWVESVGYAWGSARPYVGRGREQQRLALNALSCSLLNTISCRYMTSTTFNSYGYRRILRFSPGTATVPRRMQLNWNPIHKRKPPRIDARRQTERDAGQQSRVQIYTIRGHDTDELGNNS